MAIAFVLDEHLRGKPLWPAIRHRNLAGRSQIDATRVGDPADLPLGSRDSYILMWAERVGRIVITEDAATFPAELATHLAIGRTSPGVFVLTRSASVAVVLSWLLLVASDDKPAQWRDRITYIP